MLYLCVNVSLLLFAIEDKTFQNYILYVRACVRACVCLLSLE